MKFKNKLVFFTIFLFFLIISSGIVFAQDSPMPLIEDGEVSGDVDVSSVNPFTSTNGELVYEIPENVSEIKSVNVVVSSYSGSGAPTYGLTTNISLKSNNVTKVLEYANLTYSSSTASDPTIYLITNLTSKQYSDYQSLIDITDKVKNLSSGDTITISVNNTALEGYSFDGRIKLIALIFAYDNTLNDNNISYWLNVGQAWTKETLTTIFNTKDLNKYYTDVSLESIALSSSDATYMLNNQLLTDPIQEKGSYYIYDTWNITENFKWNSDTNLTYTSSKASTYASYKAVIQLLKITTTEKYISAIITPQYASTVFAGVNNTLTINITNDDKAFEGSVELLIGDKEIASCDINIDANNKSSVALIDTTIRPVDETTVNGAANNKVNYTLLILDKNGNVLNSTNVSYNVLYNGNLGKDFAYPASNASVNRFYNITGNVVYIVQNDSAYAGTGVTHRESVFNVNESGIVEGLFYVPYNWDKIAGGDFNSWNITFNGNVISPIASYRDQSNLGAYGKYGYGLVVYNVTSLIDDGDNVLVLNKTNGSSAVYPSALLLLSDNENTSTYKEVYIAENADLLSKPVNTESGSYTLMNINGTNMINSVLYVFSAGGQNKEGNIIVNDNTTYENVWNGTSSSLAVFEANMTKDIKNENVIYFQSTGSTILALQDILVLEFEKITPQLNITSANITLGNNVTVNVSLPQDATGNVTMGNVTIELKNGEASFIVSNLDIGEYNFTVNYSGNFKYNPTNNMITVNVKKDKSVNLSAPDVEKYYRGSERFYVYLSDSKSNPINNKTVIIIINGVEYTRQTDKNGSASIALGTKSGVYNVNVKFNGTDDYDSAEINSTVTIKSTIVGEDIVKIFRNGTQYYATFKDSNGNLLSNGTTVTFNINGMIYERQVNENGTARLNINLAQGEYIITATNPNTAEKASNNITILPKFTEQQDLVKYFKNNSQYVVRVIGSDGNFVGANETVKFNINGVIYERKTNESGYAKININLQAGNYIITATYDGCNIANNITIKPVLNASNITMSYRDGTQFKVTLVDGQGKPYSGQNVTFNINGVFYIKTTDSNGVAALNINLMSGEYIITSSYNGCNVANRIKING